MWIFAWSNLLTRPLRTVLALIGLSIPILGVIGLFSLSGGLRNLVGDTLSQIQGVMVLRENAPSPVFSDTKADMADTLSRVPGVRVVAPEVWKISPPIEGSYLIKNLSKLPNLMSKQGIAQSLLDTNVIQGQDIPQHRKLKSAVYPKALKEGRFLEARDRGQLNAVISRKIAAEHKDASGRPKQIGDSIHIGEKSFKVIGIYETGSMFLDVIVVMDIDVARTLLNLPTDYVSSFYVEANDPAKIDTVAQSIEAAVPGLDARSMKEFQANFGMLMGQLDKFLLMTVSLALLVGIVGIVNTMLMSTTERFAEFGVLRTNGWSQKNVLTLVTAESRYLGFLAGVLGCVLALVGTMLANQLLSGGLQLSITPSLLALGIALSVVMGTLGGLYPAWRAARLVPMEAIRLGSR